jgi:hypothetical protein
MNSRVSNLLKLLVGAILSFFGFWGISFVAVILASSVTGRPVGETFPHKGLVLLAIVVLQIGMYASYPIRRPIHLWLRLSVVAAGIALASVALLNEVAPFGVVNPRLGLVVAALFALGICVFLAPTLKKSIPAR